MTTNKQQLQETWDHLGATDPLWAVLSDPTRKGNKWKLDEFFAEGTNEITALIKELNHLDPKPPRRRALDFGCGVGRLSKALAKHYENVVGIDIAPSMLKHAEQHKGDDANIDFVLNSEDDLSVLGKLPFDLIYTRIVLQHMRPKYARRYIAEFIRLLSPDGVLVFQVPAEHHEQPQGLKRKVRDAAPAAVRKWYDTKQMTRGKLEIELYGIPLSEVAKLVSQHDARIVEVTGNDDAGAEWISYRYVVRRQSSRNP